MYNLTRERIRQIEGKALCKLRGQTAENTLRTLFIKDSICIAPVMIRPGRVYSGQSRTAVTL